MNTKSFLSTFNSIETVINSLVRMIVNIFTFAITEVAPMVAPLPPAFSIYRAMSERLHVPVYVAIIAAVAIEIIGMFSSKVSIRCYQWNVGRNKSEASVPQGLSILMTSIFFLVVLLLALTVELFPNLTALVIPGFVLIAISVYVNLAIHTNLEKLEADKSTNLELRGERNGLAVQVRKAQKDLAELATQAALASQEARNSQSELATLKAELATGQQAKIDLEAKLAELKKLATNGQIAGQYEGNWLVNGQNGGQFGAANLSRANAVKVGKVEARRSKMVELLAKNDQLTNAELASLLEVGISTIKADKKALNGKVKV